MLVPVTTDDDLKLVLEAAGLDGAVHPALLGRALLPPPAAGALLGTGVHGSGAGVTADRLVALVVQRVAWDVVRADVLPDLFLGPVRQRVDLDQATVVVVDLD